MNALNFDPYAALAEIQNGPGLRAKRANRANPAHTLAPLAQLALSPRHDRKSAPSEWTTALASLDTSRPIGGMPLERWRALIDDARWLARHHGEAAAAFGWSASDLFGLDPVRNGWGGLADRLEGARCLALTARVAHWRGADCEGWLWRHSLTAKPLIWEAC